MSCSSCHSSQSTLGSYHDHYGPYSYPDYVLRRLSDFEETSRAGCERCTVILEVVEWWEPDKELFSYGGGDEPISVIGICEGLLGDEFKRRGLKVRVKTVTPWYNCPPGDYERVRLIREFYSSSEATEFELYTDSGTWVCRAGGNQED